MLSIVEFSHSVLFVKKRLVTHFGLRNNDASTLVDKHRSYVHTGYMQGYPADYTAKSMIENVSGNNPSLKENPISNRTLAIYGVATALTGLGIYYLFNSKSNTVSTTNNPYTPATFSIPVDNQIQPIGPIGVEPLAV